MRFLAAAVAFVFLPLSAHAQILGAGSDGTILIRTTPEYVGPNERIALRASSAFIDLSESEIVWSADGKTIAQGAGFARAEVRSGGLGSSLSVSVFARAPDGTRASGSIRLRPAELDLLWEADSYVPPFYRGRALPSPGTDIRIQAIPRFSPAVLDTNITYTWRRNGAVIGNASGKGRSFALLSAPTLYGSDTVTVEAHAPDGAVAGGELLLRSEEPRLALYETHPIFGIMFNRVFGSKNAVSGGEASFVAIPYFADADRRDDGQLRYSWLVNGQGIAADTERPSEITINSERSDGSARLEGVLRHVTNFLIDSKSTWDITFGADSSNAPDPFRAQ